MIDYIKKEIANGIEDDAERLAKQYNVEAEMVYDILASLIDCDFVFNEIDKELKSRQEEGII